MTATKQVTIRLTVSKPQRDALKKLADKAGMKFSAYMISRLYVSPSEPK